MITAGAIITCLVSMIYLRKCFCEKQILNDYIRHYETLNYDINDLHSRHRRAVGTDQYLRFNIHAHHRNFRLKLQRDDSIFMPEHVLEWNGAKHNIDTSFLYTGVLVDDAGSVVHGSIINGTFRGEIRLHQGPVYHIEHADHYFGPHRTFHSIIYNLDDVTLDPYKKLRDSEGTRKVSGSCGLDAVHARMRQVASSFVLSKRNDSPKPPLSSTAQMYRDNHLNKYSYEANVRRHKRATKIKSCALRKNTCTLYLRADPVLMKYYTDKRGKFKYDEERAKDEIMSIFSSHVQAINHIYGKTNFKTSPPNDDCYGNIQFRVRRTKIMTEASEKCNRNGASEFCNSHLDVSNFLNLNSQSNHSEFCLAYVFTRRDFAKGTLGLAWVAGVDGTRGGICEKHEEFRELHGVKRYKSLNTGVITFVNYQKSVPPRVSQLTFAHEVGHNFGSPHDSGIACAPFGTSDPAASKGNYIMFASATQGDNINNNEFSSCSKDNMTRVIKYVVSSPTKNCFIASKESYCGNGIVETNEQCDCGFDAEECAARNDSCCHPHGHPKECTLRMGECSPSQGPCCNPGCQFIKDTEEKICRARTDCSNITYCSGKNATCPPPLTFPDKTLCDNNQMTCVNGECQGSVCEKIDWKQCFMRADTKDPAYRDKLCFVACYNNATDKCISSNDPASMDAKFKYLIRLINNNKSINAVKLPPGSPCDQYRGYCDVFSKCRGVDAQGPLARLKNLIFSKETLAIIRAWIQSHWWAVLLMCIGMVIFMGLFIAVCAVNTPSSNPRKSNLHKLTDTLRRRSRHNRSNNANNANNANNTPRNHPPAHSQNVNPDRVTTHSQPTIDLSDPPPPYYYPSRPSGVGPAPGARANKPHSHGYEMMKM